MYWRQSGRMLVHNTKGESPSGFVFFYYLGADKREDRGTTKVLKIYEGR